MRILAGDIGGTKTVLAVYERSAAGQSQLVARSVYASQQYPSFEAVLEAFVASQPLRVTAAALGVAGPVVGDTCSTTNLPWQLDASRLRARLGVPVSLLNDFHAVALGIPQLVAADVHVLQAGEHDPGAAFAVIGAGTGLGEAIGVPTRDGVVVLAGEGGQADFAARDEQEIRLLRHLLASRPRVSVEHVVSGLGLAALYDFVVADGQAAADPTTLARFASEPAGAVIAERAPVDPAAERALALFVSAYGAEAGNLALQVLPRGGLYIAGGIAPKLLARLCDGRFMTSFLAKAPMSQILERLRVAVVMQPDVGLLGARARAELSSH